MAEDNQSLDNFFTNNENNENKKEKKTEEFSLEDEFSRLLNNFIQDGDNNSEEKTLDSFISLEKNDTPAINKSNDEENLDDFITQTPSASPANNEASETLPKMFEKIVASPIESEDNFKDLKSEEFELSRAVENFKDGIFAIANKKNLNMPETDYNTKMLHPNYKPSVGAKIAKYILECWDLLNKYDPENMKRLSKDATDEEYLVFAETLTDTDMQLTIISYVEILINLEICEVKYDQLKEIAVKNRIKKELYEEYIKLQERKALFIQKLKEQKFPINVDKLINNYFNAAQKDGKGAFVALTKNPAMFSPIEFDKIKPKFFGLIKVTPEDGIKFNQKIGAFIKKLKI